MRRKGGGPGGVPGGKGNFGKGNFGTPERYQNPRNYADMGGPNFRTSPYGGGKGAGSRFGDGMGPQGHWSRPCENPGRNWQSIPPPPLPAGGYGSQGVGNYAGKTAVGHGMMASNAILKFKIPTFAYDKVMGVENDVLRRISRETSSQISELAGRDEIGQATLLLEAASQAAVDSAIRELEEVIFTCEKPIPGPGESQEFLPMYAADAAKMEGYRSSVIDDLKKRSGCRMEVTLARPDADADDNMLTIVGSAEQVKIGMMLAAQVLSGQIDSQAIERRFREAHAGCPGEASSLLPSGPLAVHYLIGHLRIEPVDPGLPSRTFSSSIDHVSLVECVTSFPIVEGPRMPKAHLILVGIVPLIFGAQFIFKPMLSTSSLLSRPSFAFVTARALWRPLAARCLSTASSPSLPTYSVRTEGQTLTDKYRVFITGEAGSVVSPWHDIPLWSRPGEKWKETGLHCNYIAEIQHGMRAKFEVATKEPHNPIRQDTKSDGKLRFYGKEPCFNYGALPQTWEDPSAQDAETKLYGDRDPLDLVELSEAPLPTGTLTEVKILGCFCLLDQGEVDWKVLAINTGDAWSKRLGSLDDVEKYMPGRVEEVMHWFKTYKMLEGKPENEIGYGGQALPLERAFEVITTAHVGFALFSGQTHLI
ncbi:hypothetical protein FOL46_005309 [Perkinsus olseni]|nr:hypothetical protein FOL46_005309 [Perkinsus olseni]